MTMPPMFGILDTDSSARAVLSRKDDFPLWEVLSVRLGKRFVCPGAGIRDLRLDRNPTAPMNTFSNRPRAKRNLVPMRWLKGV